jgi:hypothetical protein
MSGKKRMEIFRREGPYTHVFLDTGCFSCFNRYNLEAEGEVPRLVSESADFLKGLPLPGSVRFFGIDEDVRYDITEAIKAERKSRRARQRNLPQ